MLPILYIMYFSTFFEPNVSFFSSFYAVLLYSKLLYSYFSGIAAGYIKELVFWYNGG